MKMFFALLALAVAACTAVPAFAAESFNITDLVRLSPAQLDAGIARAKAAGDYGIATVQCLEGIAAYNAANPPKAVLPTKPVDAVDAIVEAHLLANGLATGTVELFPKEIRVACSEYVYEVMRNVNRTGLKVAPKVLGLF